MVGRQTDQVCRPVEQARKNWRPICGAREVGINLNSFREINRLILYPTEIIRQWGVENQQTYHVMMGTHDQTGDETQTDDEVVVRSQVETQTHQAVGSVAGDPMSTEHDSGSRVASGSGDLT